jgi:nitroreductase
MDEPTHHDLPTSLAILNRRATARFDTARPVDDQILEAVLILATRAPSAYNLQPWRFIVVRSARNRERLRTCAFGQAKVAEAPVVVIVLAYLYPHRTHLAPMLDEQVRRGRLDVDRAKALAGRATATLERHPNLELWAVRSTMLAAATLMIAAEGLGLNSAPMEGFDPEAVRREFGIPDDHAIACLVALGHAAEQTPYGGRFGLDEVAYAEHFGQPFRNSAE